MASWRPHLKRAFVEVAERFFLAPARLEGGTLVYLDYLTNRLQGGSWLAKEKALNALMRRFVMGSAAFIDVGASFGLHSVLVSRLTGKPVLAVEPQRRLLRLIERSRRKNRLVGLHAHEGCVGARDEQVELTVPILSTGFASTRGNSELERLARSEGVRRLRAKSLPLDVLVEAYEATRAGEIVLKIDAEGAEMDILDGAPRTLSRTRALFFEANDDALAERGTSGDELIARVQSMGFAVYVADTERRALVPVDDARNQRRDGCADVVAVRPTDGRPALGGDDLRW